MLRWEPLQAWIETAPGIPGSGPVLAVQELAGGTQNGVYRLVRQDAAVVLRRPPQLAGARGDAMIGREATVLAALADSDVPHPRLLARCDDLGVLGCRFFVMEELQGFTPRGNLPGDYADKASWRRAMSEQLVIAAARLAAVEPASAGLAGLSQTDRWIERQVDRWRNQLEGYLRLDGYDQIQLPHTDAVALWLERNQPATARIGLLHGDVHWANVMFSYTRPAVVGLVDWELSALGDPLLDLAWLQNGWCEEDDPPGHDDWFAPLDGILRRRDVVRLYGEVTGRDMSVAPWFDVLACYKLAVLLEGTLARSIAGLAPTQWAAYLHKRAVWLMERAGGLIRRA